MTGLLSSQLHGTYVVSQSSCRVIQRCRLRHRCFGQHVMLQASQWTEFGQGGCSVDNVAARILWVWYIHVFTHRLIIMMNPSISCIDVPERAGGKHRHRDRCKHLNDNHSFPCASDDQLTLCECLTKRAEQQQHCAQAPGGPKNWLSHLPLHLQMHCT